MKVTCQHCKGKGKVLIEGEWFPCEVCNGSGKVEVSDEVSGTGNSEEDS